MERCAKLEQTLCRGALLLPPRRAPSLEALPPCWLCGFQGCGCSGPGSRAFWSRALVPHHHAGPLRVQWLFPRLLEEGVPLTLFFLLFIRSGAGFWRRHPEVCRCVLRRRQSQRRADAQRLSWEPPGFHPAFCREPRGTALSPALSRASTGALRRGRSGGGEGAL